MSGPVLLALRIAIATALYSFLGWGLWLLWRDLRRQSRLLGAAVNPALVMTRQGSAPPVTYRFTSPEVTVGRDTTCECRLNDPIISARHARFSFHHAQWWIEDLHSRNGTFLNDEPVRSQVVVTSGDSLRCGTLVFLITIVVEDA
jgi:pSer/pThr/pTyr-binding forkhead associated (FHA) protein